MSQNEIDIDVSRIPQHTVDYLADATLEFMHWLLQQPGMKEKLEILVAEKNTSQQVR